MTVMALARRFMYTNGRVSNLLEEAMEQEGEELYIVNGRGPSHCQETNIPGTPGSEEYHIVDAEKPRCDSRHPGCRSSVIAC